MGILYPRGIESGTIVDENSFSDILSKLFGQDFFVVDKTDESLIKFPYWVSQGVFLLN
jgi:hypothetical protein